jgi:hypothetical protein
MGLPTGEMPPQDSDRHLIRYSRILTDCFQGEFVPTTGVPQTLETASPKVETPAELWELPPGGDYHIKTP